MPAWRIRPRLAARYRSRGRPYRGHLPNLAAEGEEIDIAGRLVVPGLVEACFGMVTAGAARLIGFKRGRRSFTRREAVLHRPD